MQFKEIGNEEVGCSLGGVVPGVGGGWLRWRCCSGQERQQGWRCPHDLWRRSLRPARGCLCPSRKAIPLGNAAVALTGSTYNGGKRDQRAFPQLFSLQTLACDSGETGNSIAEMACRDGLRSDAQSWKFLWAWFVVPPEKSPQAEGTSSSCESESVGVSVVTDSDGTGELAAASASAVGTGAAAGV